MRSRLFASVFSTLALPLLLAAPAAAKAPEVVATIHPVQSLVAAVMHGVGEPRRLLPAGASPHSYALKPSEAHMLSQATVVFRVDPGLETFLTQTLDSLAGDATVVTLADAPGTLRLPARAGGAWEHDHEDEHEDHGHGDKHDHGEKHGHGDKHGHGEDGGIDGHLWLDPRNAAAWTTAIAEALSQADPTNAATYASNAEATRSRLAELEKRLAERLAPVAGTPYLVFHDAYQYFENRFGLNAVGAVTVSPDQTPGARRISELRTLVRDSGAACVFAEPQFEPRLVGVVIEGTPARSAVLDPIGATIPAGPDLYPTLLENLANGLTGCLSRR
ncbi:zinc ABC transporter substrate-binding protein [Novispirillum sp. DQ9]|uniref:zinc ABC transporter substrate-binding protein n=1 Tax=Novispirillum sp. DQ9 TaxID=3398612 RepID=UPI003C7AE952